MTGPTPERLHHLADRARRGVALPAEHDQLVAGITAMAERADRAEAALDRVRQLHRETCPVAKGTLSRTAFGCSMCEALDEQQPTTTEHCGHQPPRFSEYTLSTECALRPGHQGSHADDRGMRWWHIDNEHTPTT